MDDLHTEGVHTGGCQCGQLRYRTEGLPVRAAVCHCRYCQTRTGSALGVSAYFPAGKVQVTGKAQDYRFTTESGRAFTTHFCPTCGTNVLWSLEMSPGLIGIAAGTFDPPTFWFPITREIFTRSDWPMIAPEKWLDAFDKAAFKDEVRPLILKENAMRLLRV